MKFNYAQTCQDLLKVLSERQKEIISRRFALNGQKKETLESIGQDLKITRERVRQIEKEAFLILAKEAKKYQEVFQYFTEVLEKTGGLRKEETLLKELGGDNFQDEVFFLLNLGKGFERFSGNKKFYSCWSNNKTWLTIQKKIDNLYQKLKKEKKPIKIEDELFISYLTISKKIKRSKKGFYGLKDWPEINPRKIKDKAYLVFKESKEPLHFTQVAELIEAAIPQTVHNELIKDSRFVLVGRGIYALKEWGYQEGQVKDVIFNILKTAGQPLGKEEILEKTLKQRVVKDSTVFLNLSNKRYFAKNSQGYYTIKEA